MIDVNKTPKHEWERTLQELQRKYDAVLVVVVVLALIIMVF